MKKRIRINYVLLLLAVVTAALSLPAVTASADAYDDKDYRAAIKNAVETTDADSLKISSKSALLMDAATGTVLFEKNADEKLPIASMTKIMTLLITFETIDKGIITAEQEVTVSSAASGMGGSQAFLEANGTYKIGDLIKSCVIASANDSSVALAEVISGSETAFVTAMNDRAAELGMANTNFANCTGLPAPNHFSTASDVAKMTKELLKHKEYYTYSTIWMEDLVHPGGRVTGLTNTNKLSRFYNGCDGGKTGYTVEAKHCISATAKRGGLRLISVIIAANDSKTRFSECSTLLNYGFGAYESKVVFSKDTAISSVGVVRGKKDKAQIGVQEDFTILNKRGTTKQEITYELKISDKLSAPIKSGDKVGTAKILKGGEVVGECDIFALETIAARNFLDVLKKFINH